MSNVIPEKQLVEEIASHLEVMGDPTRLQILYGLASDELRIVDLAELLGMSMPAISHHMRVLKNKNLVRTRHSGVSVFYSLVDECLLKVLEVAKKHIEEEHSRT